MTAQPEPTNLVTYDVETETFCDHGAITLADSGANESLGSDGTVVVSPDGSVYALGRINLFVHGLYRIDREQIAKGKGAAGEGDRKLEQLNEKLNKELKALKTKSNKEKTNNCLQRYIIWGEKIKDK